MARKKNPRLWARLRVLCSSGLDLMCIAPDALALVRELVPYDAAALFLTDETGEIQAAYLDAAFDAVRSVWVCDHFRRIPDRFKVPHLVRDRLAPKTGQLRVPPSEYLQSPTYQYVVRGAGQRHTLDARLEVGGARVGLFCLYREAGRGFDPDEAEEVSHVARYFEFALMSARCASVVDAHAASEAMMVAHSGGEIIFVSDEANVMLRELAYQRMAVPRAERLPPFCQDVVEQLTQTGRGPPPIPVRRSWTPGGILEARAQWLAGPRAGAATAGAADGRAVGIFLKRVEPVPLRVWRGLQTVTLSPQQTEVAFWLGVGTRRDELREKLGLSEAGLRDCLKVIYDRFDCSSEATLAAVLRGVAA